MAAAVTSTTGTQTLAVSAMTTPFTRPSGCPTHYETILETDRGTVYPTLISKPLQDAVYSSCEPPGWNALGPESIFHFCTAVCPHKHIAYRINSANAAEPLSSTAYCCHSDYRLSQSVYSRGALDTSTSYICALYATTGAGVANIQPGSSADGLSTATFALVLETPYMITWERQYTSMLTPKPPWVPCSNEGIPTWNPATPYTPTLCAGREVPLTYITSSSYVPKISTNETPKEASVDGTIKIIAIIVVVGVVMIAGVAGCCFWRFRQRRKNNRELQQRNAQPEGTQEVELENRNHEPGTSSRDADTESVVDGLPKYEQAIQSPVVDATAHPPAYVSR